MWGMIYHTEIEGEVKFVRPRFFAIKEQCEDWFRNNFKPETYNHPEAVQVSGLDDLVIIAIK